MFSRRSLLQAFAGLLAGIPILNRFAPAAECMYCNTDVPLLVTVTTGAYTSEGSLVSDYWRVYWTIPAPCNQRPNSISITVVECNVNGDMTKHSLYHLCYRDQRTEAKIHLEKLIETEDGEERDTLYRLIDVIKNCDDDYMPDIKEFI